MNGNNKLIYLIGFLGSSKLDIAKELCNMNKELCKGTDCVIISDGMLNEQILSIINPANKKIPDDLREKNFSIIENILAIFKEHHTESKYYIFTNELLEGDNYDQRTYKSVKNFSNQCGMKMFSVVLNCKSEESATRMQSNHRIRNEKINDPEFKIKKINEKKLFVPPGAIEIDNSNLQASETAKIIIEKIKVMRKSITLTPIIKSIKREK